MNKLKKATDTGGSVGIKSKYMSIIYCNACDEYIDTDFDSHEECLSIQEEEEKEEEFMNSGGADRW